jgi:hypothetical protein
MLKYIRAVEPGIPPLGWRDITPYFGRVPEHLGKSKLLARRSGFVLSVQTVIQNGQKYRRVAAALAPHSPAIRKPRKQK